MAEALQGTRRSYSVGNLILYVQPLVAVANSSTHASALNNIVGFWANATTETASFIKTGVDVSISGSIFTITTGEADTALTRGIDLYILTSEFE